MTMMSHIARVLESGCMGMHLRRVCTTSPKLEDVADVLGTFITRLVVPFDGCSMRGRSSDGSKLSPIDALVAALSPGCIELVVALPAGVIAGVAALSQGAALRLDDG
mmetsp:Transcript_455/g.1227  ORF Transcript_455/g.1227 Transcript_455/m.1227 type:complete len:107 (-) Transcript_455:393-713(-)